MLPRGTKAALTGGNEDFPGGSAVNPPLLMQGDRFDARSGTDSTSLRATRLSAQLDLRPATPEACPATTRTLQREARQCGKTQHSPNQINHQYNKSF